MRIPTLVISALCALLAVTDAAASGNPNRYLPRGTFVTVDTSNRLERFTLTAPGERLGSVAIAGLAMGENILAIDFRPATGELYGLSSASRLYKIDVVTGATTPVGAGFTPALTGADFGFDFNPVTDRARVVSDAEQNLQVDPDTGLATADTGINPAGNLVGSAYSNNTAGAASTTLYGIDSATDQLVIQNPPGAGTTTPIGPLGLDTNGSVGFDIAPTGVAYASLTSASSSLYTINLATGAATLVGLIASTGPVRGLAIVAGPETVYALTVSNKLLSFTSDKPGTILSSAPVTGLQPGENLLGIDFRPATAELYGIGSTSRLYRIDTSTATATMIGPGPFATALSGTDFGFDFNPTVDRIRIVSDAEQNMRANPETGTIAAVDAALNPAGNVVAAAYFNNFAGATATTLYDIDSGSDLLLIQNPPNNGTLTVVGPLGVDATGLTGFDIAPSGVAYASITQSGSGATGFFTLNLTTGAATLIGGIGGGELIRDVAIQIGTEIAYGVTQQAGPAFTLFRFNTAAPALVYSATPVSGLQSGESILGIDFQPKSGRLFALGSTSRLYTIDLATGAAAAVGAAPFSPALSGTSFGFDFNPTVDRVRIVSDNEQNLRANPDTGAIAAVDTILSPAGNVVGAAYANNFAGATSTVLYDVDSSSDALLIQNPPNNGTLTLVGALGVDIGPGAGFDIGQVSGRAYLSGYVGAAASPTLFTVNLATGAATTVGTIGVTDPLVGLAVQTPPRDDGLFRDGFE